MLPDLSLLVAVILGLLSLEVPMQAASGHPLRALAGTIATVVVASLLARHASERAIRWLEESEPDAARASAAWTASYPFLGWLAVLYGFGWGAFVVRSVPPWFVLPHLVLFAPLAAMTGAGWLAARRIEAHLSPDAPSGAEAIRRGLRRNAIVLVPFAVLLVVQEGVPALAALGVPGFATLVTWARTFPDLSSLALLATSVVVAFFAPALLRRLLRAQPLPDGDVRRAILQVVGSARVRVRDILLWKTDGRIVNAMLAGFTGRSRYVFVTDGLISSHPIPEVAAVVAHEAGHAKHRHLVLYLVVSVALVLSMIWAGDALAPWLGLLGPHLLPLLFLAVFWFGFVGWLSRRFEREADVFAAEHATAGAAPDTGGPTALEEGSARFAAALARIGRMGGRVRTLRHGSIEERIAFLTRYATDPSERERFRRRRRALLAAIAGFALLSLAGTAYWIPRGLARGRTALALEAAHATYEAGREREKRAGPEAARDLFRRARDAFAVVGAGAGERRDDPAVRLLAAQGTLAAAEIDLRHLRRDAESRLGYVGGLAALDALDALRRLPPAYAPDVARLRFHARIDLGRLALRDDGPVEERLARAREHLEAARRLPEEPDEGPYRRARLRLLEAAIGLREPERAAAARSDLLAQAAQTQPGDEWYDLQLDATQELERIAPSPPR